MYVEIISDKLLDLAQESNFAEGYHREDVTIRSWEGFHDTPITPNVLVVDLDLSRHTNDYGNVPLFGNIVEMRENFQRLSGIVARFIESGGVFVVLLSGKTTLPALNTAHSYGWLDQLQMAEIIENDGRSQIEVISELDAVHRYFDFVESYDRGIRIRDDVVEAPEVIARNAVDQEPAAVAVDEYLDPNGVPREARGQVILLPQPTDLPQPTPLTASRFFDLIDAVVDLGEAYLPERGGEVEEISPQRSRLELPVSVFDEEILERCAHHFEQENFEEAVQNALKTLEVKIRDEGDFPQTELGDNLATQAFHPEEGPLSFGETEAERQGVMFLYRSAFKTFYNPSKHRFLDDLDKKQTYHILCFVNMLITLMEENPIDTGEGD